MNEEELRSLDAYLAEHVMGWKRVMMLAEIEDGIFILDRNNKVLVSAPHNRLELFCPTEHNAPAMAVLEKLAGKTAVAIYQGETTGKWYVDVASENSNDPVFSEWAETLPLAICKAAKAYFEFHAKTSRQSE